MLIMKKNIEDVFEITNFIDEARWSSDGNYYSINYANENLPLDDKILTHYITYITDRQMAFMRIWNIGGFVFSRLVEEYRKRCIDTIEFYEIKNDKLFFICSVDEDGLTAKQKDLLEDSIHNNIVKFSSRFTTSDFCSIYFTLYILERLEKDKIIEKKSLVEYIKKVVKNHSAKKDDIVKRIAFSLYVLTYQGKNRDKNESVEDFVTRVKKLAKEQYEYVKKLLKDEMFFEEEYKKFLKNKIYTSKRVWCSLRDYMKAPEFKDYFSNEIYPILGCDICSIDYWKQLELPGDVWNNNSTFAKCNFPGKIVKPQDTNKCIRSIYDESQPSKGYVEQFDITFSLAPRMCEEKKCSYCPYGILDKNDKHNFSKMCVNNKEKLCPVVLYSTGFEMNCKGKEDCDLYKINLKIKETDEESENLSNEHSNSLSSKHNTRLSGFLVTANGDCPRCGKSYSDFGVLTKQGVSFHCDRCNAEYELCPDCIKNVKVCPKCGGRLLDSWEYSEKMLGSKTIF